MNATGPEGEVADRQFVPGLPPPVPIPAWRPPPVVPPMVPPIVPPRGVAAGAAVGAAVAVDAALDGRGRRPPVGVGRDVGRDGRGRAGRSEHDAFHHQFGPPLRGRGMWGGCQCDFMCIQWGDCCFDYFAVCGAVVPPPVVPMPPIPPVPVAPGLYG